jgi:serine/threonine protein kinase
VTPEQWNRAKLVLEGARRHNPSDRSQYVSVACADDPELLKEVESLLDLSSTPPPGRSGEPSGPALTQWEHLTVLAEAGRGAFGRVYRAWDPALQDEVALKLIRVDMREPEFADSVFNEARLLVKVRHPHIVSVLGARRVGPDVGIWMEFINGPTLADAVERGGPMGPVDAAAAGIAVCDALAAVHGTGLLHRDIKARNVMRDPSGRVVLMDFGAGADRRQLPSGEMAGTPLYMAPEVLKGAGASIASDIYSVGVLLFHLVTGEYPVSGRNLYELEAAHESGARARLADRRPDLPDSFVDAVDRALSPDPAERFRRAVEFKDALIDATARLTAPVVVPTQAALLERWPWLVGLALAVALLTATLLGFLTSAWFNLSLGRDGVNARFANESPVDWPIWGIRAVLGPVIYVGIMMLLAILVRWLALMIGSIVRRVWPRAGRGAVSRSWNGLRSMHPNTAVRLAAVVGTLALVGTVWQFADLVNAVAVKINTATPDELAPLAPDNDVQRVLYRRALEITMLIVGVGLYRGIRLRGAAGARLDAAATAWACGVFTIALLLTVLPFRVTLQNDQFVRAQFDGMRCYVIGQDGRDRLLYCPELGITHNRTVSLDDPRLRPEGIYESIFIPLAQAAPSPAQ